MKLNNSFCTSINDGFGCVKQDNPTEWCEECLLELLHEIITDIRYLKSNKNLKDKN